MSERRRGRAWLGAVVSCMAAMQALAPAIPGTEGAWSPRFAPDGERVAFDTVNGGRTVVKVLSLAGGPPTTVVDSGVGSTVSCGPDDDLYFIGAAGSSVLRVSASGGVPEVVTTLQAAPGTRFAWPTVLPDGNGLIVSTIPPGTSPSSATTTNGGAGLEVQVYDLSSGVSRASVAGAFGLYSPTGHLVYATSDRTDLDEEDPLEIEASKYNLNYIKLNGNVGCMVNGAGLAMATMDIIKLAGGEPANFLDVGGGASKETVANGFEIILSDKNVKAIVINIFGGIVRCDRVAQGVIDAAKEMHVAVPIVVRLEGTNAKEAGVLLRESGLNFEVADSFDDAAKKVTAVLKK